MEEEDIILIENIFVDFKEKLSKDIDNTSISMKNKDCYLIEVPWYNKLTDCFEKYHDYKNNNEIDENTNFEDFLPKNDPQFINNFSSIISCLKNNKNMIIVSQEWIESIYEIDDLKEYNKIKYYAGNKKLIIKFENNSNNQALLIINPNNIIQKNNNIFIIDINEEKKGIQQLLSQENIINNEIYFDNNYNIIPLVKYLELLKLLIYIHYYEKSLLNNKEDILKENEDYYLINPDWINNIKQYFENYFKTLNTIKARGYNINYSNLKKWINGIISARNNLNFEDIKLFKEIINAKNIGATKKSNNQIIYHPNCYIINSEIMDIIKFFYNNKDLVLKKKRIFTENENIYIIYMKHIIIGNLNEKLLFIPNYIISYNNSKILQKGYEYLISNSFERYIKSLNCKLKYTGLQVLKNNNEKIGKFIILNKNIINKDNDDDKYNARSAESTPEKKNKFINIINKSKNKSRNENKIIKRENSDENNSLYKTAYKTKESDTQCESNNINNIDLRNEELLNLNKQLEQYKNEKENLIKQNLNDKKKYEKKEKEFLDKNNELEEIIKKKRKTNKSNAKKWNWI